MKKYRSIFLSDIHLGTRSCKADILVNFLKHNDCDTLYLVGDIVDGWKVTQNRWKWHKDQTKVVEKILKMSRKHNTKIIYVPGNHDEFLRPMSNQFTLGDVQLHNQYTHIGVDGKRYLVTHGDMFDGITEFAPWVSFLGDRAYDCVLSVNNTFNAIRRKFGYNYWSLSKYLKYKVKKAIEFIFKFESNLAGYCKRKGFDGVCCGHIHHAEIKEIDGVMYMNSGDWVESCTALVEHHEGHFEIIAWQKQNETPCTSD